MNVQAYLQQRKNRQEAEPRYRDLCVTCLQPPFGCYCKSISRFDPGIDFVILIHPMELKRRIATGRMSHLCLVGSQLLPGKDFTDDERVNRLLDDPSRLPVMLYPGRNAVDLSRLKSEERQTLFPRERRLTVFVLDGTWRTVRPMVRSENLRQLPCISFSLERSSGFGLVRKQPAKGCFSTIEAIHQTIELLSAQRGVDLENRPHDELLRVFEAMVARQQAAVERGQSISMARQRAILPVTS